MKNLSTFLLVFFGATPLLFSQITMTKASHGFFNGQDHECQAVQYLSPGEAGKNCVWDFSDVALLENTKSVSKMEDDPSTAGTIKADRNDGCEFFFTTTENANEYWGYKAGNLKMQLTEPIVKTKYPQSYGTQFSGNYSGFKTSECSDLKFHVEGRYSTHADGIGTIILPGGVSMPALRIKTTEGYSGFERVKYLWYAQDIRLPIFVVIEDYMLKADGTNKLTAAEAFLNLKFNVKETAKASTAAELSYKVFPNPFRDNIQVTYSLPETALVTVELFTSGGAKLVTLLANQEQKGKQTLSQDVSKYATQPGVYLLKITVGDKTYIEKLVKTY